MEIRNYNLLHYNSMEKIGAVIIRYGTFIILMWIGLLKFATYEAMAIKPLVSNGVLAWGYSIMSVQNFAALIGTGEILAAILIAISPVAPRISVFGSYIVIIMAIITLSFLFTTPAKVIWQKDHGSFPFLTGMPGMFLLKDLLLLGAGFWTAGESIRLSKKDRTDHRNAKVKV